MYEFYADKCKKGHLEMAEKQTEGKYGVRGPKTTKH